MLTGLPLWLTAPYGVAGAIFGLLIGHAVRARRWRDAGLYILLLGMMTVGAFAERDTGLMLFKFAPYCGLAIALFGLYAEFSKQTVVSKSGPEPQP